MELSGEQKKALRDALTSAFGDYDALRMMVAFGLDENLNAIAHTRNINNAAFDLVSGRTASVTIPLTVTVTIGGLRPATSRPMPTTASIDDGSDAIEGEEGVAADSRVSRLLWCALEPAN